MVDTLKSEKAGRKMVKCVSSSREGTDDGQTHSVCV